MSTWIDGYDTNGVIVFIAVSLLPAVVAVARLYRFPSRLFIDRWFVHHDLEQSDESVAFVGRSLRRTKQIRTAGFILGYSGIQLGWMAYTRDARRSGDLPFISLFLACWAIAVTAAAVWSTPRSTGLASLAERRLDDYRPAFWRFDREILVAAMLVLVALSFTFPGQRNGTTIDGGVALQRVVPALAAMVMVLVAQRFIVGKRQSLSSLDLVQADDALRSVGVSALTGIGYGIPLLVVSSLFWELTVVREPSGLVMVGVMIVAIAVHTMGLGMILGLGRLSNGVVVYRHRFRWVS